MALVWLCLLVCSVCASSSVPIPGGVLVWLGACWYRCLAGAVERAAHYPLGVGIAAEGQHGLARPVACLSLQIRTPQRHMVYACLLRLPCVFTPPAPHLRGG